MKLIIDVGIGDTTKEKMFIRYVWGLIFSGFGATCMMTGFEDNSERARHLAQNPVCTSNSMHIVGSA